MKTWKRALALVLALVMALSLVALPSFAAGEETGGKRWQGLYQGSGRHSRTERPGHVQDHQER